MATFLHFTFLRKKPAVMWWSSNIPRVSYGGGFPQPPPPPPFS